MTSEQVAANQKRRRFKRPVLKLVVVFITSIFHGPTGVKWGYGRNSTHLKAEQIKRACTNEWVCKLFLFVQLL
ncbi:MAG: hypothetical protein WCP62_02590, partial [Planctomycetota bacterium]